MRKIALILMLLAFITILISIGGMQTSYHKEFKEIHETAGLIFIVLIFYHIFVHKFALKQLFSKQKNVRPLNIPTANPKENTK